jgi:hypothetical protein
MKCCISVCFKDAKYVNRVLQLLPRDKDQDEKWVVITDNDGDPLPLPIDLLHVYNRELPIFKQGEGNGAKILSDVQEAMLGGQTLVEAVTDMFPPTTQ